MMLVRSNRYSNSSRVKSLNCKKCLMFSAMMFFRSGLQEIFNQRAQDIQRLPGFVLRHDERRQQPDHVVGGDVDQQTLRERLFHQVAARFVELDADHQPLASYRPDAVYSLQGGGKAVVK